MWFSLIKKINENSRFVRRDLKWGTSQSGLSPWCIYLWNLFIYIQLSLPYVYVMKNEPICVYVTRRVCMHICNCIEWLNLESTKLRYASLQLSIITNYVYTSSILFWVYYLAMILVWFIKKRKCMLNFCMTNIGKYSLFFLLLYKIVTSPQWVYVYIQRVKWKRIVEKLVYVWKLEQGVELKPFSFVSSFPPASLFSATPLFFFSFLLF